MIEVVELNRPQSLAAAEACLAAVMRAEADLLAVAGHWAHLHDPASLVPAETVAEERRRRLEQAYGVQPGGEGTPEVVLCCFAELGLVLRTSAGGARHLVADALDLRHRLPRLWREVQSGQVRSWRARKVAQATRHLPLVTMGDVDTGLAGLLSVLPWSRFEAVLDATVKRADPAGAAHAEAEAAARRFVALARDDGGSQDRDCGLKTLIARGEVLDIVTFLAAVDRVADCLAADGDTDTLDVRRSKAVGILGQPDRALALLAAHAHDEDTPSAPESDHGTAATELTAETSDAPPEDEPARGPEPDRVGTRSIDLTRPVPIGESAARIRVQLYVHLTDTAPNGTDPTAVCRVEGAGPITAATVRHWLRRPDVKITVRPVVVPGDAVPVDGYEIPRTVRQSVVLRNPASAFPWSSCTDRTALQLDHVKPYLAPVRGGPPGQTDPANLAPLTQTEHTPKTSGRWRERTPAPGVYLWRSPHGWITLVTNQGTYTLGTTATAQAIWIAAGTSSDSAPSDAQVHAA